MRALVISDTHFGAWTGEDLLREPENLALLGPHLDVDEVVILGDLFDFMFASLEDAFTAADGLLDLLASRLQGKRLVFLAGNHDHHLVIRQAEALLQQRLAAGDGSEGLREVLQINDPFQQFLGQRLRGVEVDIRYPTYTFGGVLCTHGHFLDVHARHAGSGPERMLGNLIWSISVGGKHTPALQDYEATTSLLTGLLYTIAQLPNGTHAQRRAFQTFKLLERAGRLGTAPARALERKVQRTVGQIEDRRSAAGREQAEYVGARSREMERRRRTGAPAGGEATSYALARRVRPSDPIGKAVAAFEPVVTNLGWGRDTDKIVFAHTHQPLDGVRGPGGSYRYWNTGSWIYEPDLSSQRAYAAYLRNAWPGTAVLIDTAEPEPRLLRLREHLNPLTSERSSTGPDGRGPPR